MAKIKSGNATPRGSIGGGAVSKNVSRQQKRYSGSPATPNSFNKSGSNVQTGKGKKNKFSPQQAITKSKKKGKGEWKTYEQAFIPAMLSPMSKSSDDDDEGNLLDDEAEEGEEPVQSKSVKPYEKKNKNKNQSVKRKRENDDSDESDDGDNDSDESGNDSDMFDMSASEGEETDSDDEGSDFSDSDGDEEGEEDGESDGSDESEEEEEGSDEEKLSQLKTKNDKVSAKPNKNQIAKGGNQTAETKQSNNKDQKKKEEQSPSKKQLKKQQQAAKQGNVDVKEQQQQQQSGQKQPKKKNQQQQKVKQESVADEDVEMGDQEKEQAGTKTDAKQAAKKKNKKNEDKKQKNDATTVKNGDGKATSDKSELPPPSKFVGFIKQIPKSTSAEELKDELSKSVKKDDILEVRLKKTRRNKTSQIALVYLKDKKSLDTMLAYQFSIGDQTLMVHEARESKEKKVDKGPLAFISRVPLSISDESVRNAVENVSGENTIVSFKPKAISEKHNRRHLLVQFKDEESLTAAVSHCMYTIDGETICVREAVESSVKVPVYRIVLSPIPENTKEKVLKKTIESVIGKGSVKSISYSFKKKSIIFVMLDSEASHQKALSEDTEFTLGETKLKVSAFKIVKKGKRFKKANKDGKNENSSKKNQNDGPVKQKKSSDGNANKKKKFDKQAQLSQKSSPNDAVKSKNKFKHKSKKIKT